MVSGRLRTLLERLHVSDDIINLHADVLLRCFILDPVILGFSIYLTVRLAPDIALE